MLKKKKSRRIWKKRPLRKGELVIHPIFSITKKYNCIDLWYLKTLKNY